MKRILKKLIISIFMISLVTLHPSALENKLFLSDETDNRNNLGSITITLDDTDTLISKKDVVFAIVKVADIHHGQYVLHEDFSAAKIDFNDITTADKLEETALTLKNYIRDYDTSVSTDENGCCSFENLSMGIYLIYPVDLALYEDIAPFLIAMPTFDESEKEMSYTVNVLPKHVPNTVISILKVDQETPSKVLKDAEFTLYDSFKNPLQTVCTNENGIAEFLNIKDGTYYLKETKAPKGYQLSKDEIQVIVDKKSNNDNIYQLTIPNTKIPTITTSDTAQINRLAAISGFALTTIVVAAKKKRKSDA